MSYWVCPYCKFRATTEDEQGAHLKSYPRHAEVVLEELGLK